MRKIWIIAGESSGDLYGAALAAELRRLADAEGEELAVSGMGGKAMIAAGIPVKVDSTELGVMGVFEVLKLLFTFVRIFFRLLGDLKRERPDAVVLIDYPGFNLLFALAAYFNKVKVVWYVCPQLWVWGKWRLPVLSRICTKMLVIFPFEVEVFAPTPLKATFVGHPLADMVAKRLDPAIRREENRILLLPGSRKMEIDKLLIPMLESVAIFAKKHPQYTFQLAAPRERTAALCTEKIAAFRKKHPELPAISVSVGQTAQEMQRCIAGVAASGTVTVECALSGLPLVVGYKLNFFTLLLASVLVKLYRGFFTMVNIIANCEVYQEFLQWRFAPEKIVPALEAILPGGARRAEVEKGMKNVTEALHNASGASGAERAALECWKVK